MYQTIQVSTCVSAQGELVENLPNGEAIVRDGGQVYRGRPIAPVRPAGHGRARAEGRWGGEATKAEPHRRAGAARRPAGAGDRVFKRGSERRTTAERRAHVRDDRPAGIPARRGCALMGLPRSTYYAAPKGPPPDEALVAEMQAITDAFECYGYRRVGAELRHRGTVVNAKKVRRLMRENDLNPRARRRFSRTTDSDHDGPIFPFIAKDYAVHGRNQLWVGDITYVTIATGFVYLSRARWRGPPGGDAAGRRGLSAQSQPASSRSTISTIISTCAGPAFRQGM